MALEQNVVLAEALLGDVTAWLQSLGGSDAALAQSLSSSVADWLTANNGKVTFMSAFLLVGVVTNDISSWKVANPGNTVTKITVWSVVELGMQLVAEYQHWVSSQPKPVVVPPVVAPVVVPPKVV